MIRHLTPLGGILAALLFGPKVEGATVNEVRLLAAIAQVETGTCDTSRPSRRIGRGGERSAWQIRERTWHDYTWQPFLQASRDARLASVVAAMHLRFLRLQLEAHRVPVTAYALALAWNAGHAAVIARAEPPSSHQYAERVAALYLVP